MFATDLNGQLVFIDGADEKLHIPREYAEVTTKERPPEYSNVKGFKVKWNSIDHYRVVQKIGRGKYSEVFSGVHVENYQKVCIKILKPVRKFKILREVKIL
jgi:casein kinase II subunit alpha